MKLSPVHHGRVFFSPLCETIARAPALPVFMLKFRHAMNDWKPCDWKPCDFDMRLAKNLCRDDWKPCALYSNSAAAPVTSRTPILASCVTAFMTFPQNNRQRAQTRLNSMPSCGSEAVHAIDDFEKPRKVRRLFFSTCCPSRACRDARCLERCHACLSQSVFRGATVTGTLFVTACASHCRLLWRCQTEGSCRLPCVGFAV